MRTSSLFLVCFCFQLLHAQWSAISPVPGSEYHYTERNLLFRSSEPIPNDSRLLTSIRIEGIQSGSHDYAYRLKDNARLLYIKPKIPFKPGEKVKITTSSPLPDTTFSFYISDQVPLPPVLEPDHISPGRKTNLFPTGAAYLNDPAPGKLFFRCHSISDPLQRYAAITDNYLSPEYAYQSEWTGHAFTLNRSGYLSMYNSVNHFYIMDSSYTILDSVSCGNGYLTDPHEFLHLSSGHSYLMAYDWQTVNMNLFVPGGDSAASVAGLIVQELDEAKDVIFEWRSWDHFSILDAIGLNFTGSSIDYVHGNSIDIDTDGHLIISCRNMHEVTKINSITGEIIWRFGGKNNEFTFINDSLGFNMQHDARRISNGNLTLFDNGIKHTPPLSYVKEYQLDTATMTAELIWAYHHPDSIVSRAMGNAQRLPNGNTFINWGWRGSPDNPSFTEVDSLGSIRYELTFTQPDMLVYRGYRFEWAPLLTGIHPASETLVTLYPNPASQELNLVQNLTNTRSTLRLTDLTGRVVLKKPLYQMCETIDVSNLGNGVYILVISNGSEQFTHKVIVSH